MLLVVNSTVEDVSLKEGIGYDAVLRLIDRCIDAQVAWQALKRLEVIGIDEISLKTGHQDFVAIVTARVGDLVTRSGTPTVGSQLANRSYICMAILEVNTDVTGNHGGIAGGAASAWVSW